MSYSFIVRVFDACSSILAENEAAEATGTFLGGAEWATDVPGLADVAGQRWRQVERRQRQGEAGRGEAKQDDARVGENGGEGEEGVVMKGKEWDRN
ncbi:hypothetical protein E2C01_075327 [Portunus trituberculatus]|uniref:Uncharacterized protein n=1 Tax=Portunus trituberculatus TaxID=210409 RepID=A0A5B7IIV3_PORTR|nr:hypothetical protein [Portunus trituberculatus]